MSMAHKEMYERFFFVLCIRCHVADKTLMHRRSAVECIISIHLFVGCGHALCQISRLSCATISIQLKNHPAMTSLCSRTADPIHVVPVDGSVDAVARRLD